MTSTNTSLHPTLAHVTQRITERSATTRATYLAAMAAQREMWTIQGAQRTWFCGAYFGSGFHEDGLQAGLAVAEALGGVRRPWSVENESGRIVIGRQLEAAE
mgnify:CR=1 FL=1